MSYDSPPATTDYTSRCKLCWPDERADESSSDSEDELEMGEGRLSPKREVEQSVYSRL